MHPFNQFFLDVCGDFFQFSPRSEHIRIRNHAFIEVDLKFNAPVKWMDFKGRFRKIFRFVATVSFLGFRMW